MMYGGEKLIKGGFIMAKRQPKKIKQSEQLIKGVRIVLLFLIPTTLGILFLGYIFSLFGMLHPYRDVFIGVSIPCAFALLYRWKTGEWPTREEEKR